MMSNLFTLAIFAMALMGSRFSTTALTIFPLDSSSIDSVPFYQECKHGSNCPTGYCCNLGMMRYQMPHCDLMGHVGDPCHPYADNYRRNFTLNFPVTEVHIQEAWLVLCPCDKNLHCSKRTATCTTGNGNLNLG